MAQDHPLNFEISKVLKAEFPGECAKALVADVLEGDLDFVFDGLLDGDDMERDRSDDDVDVVEFELVDDGVDELEGLREGVIALPVASDESSSGLHIIR